MWKDEAPHDPTDQLLSEPEEEFTLGTEDKSHDLTLDDSDREDEAPAAPVAHLIRPDEADEPEVAPPKPRRAGRQRPAAKERESSNLGAVFVFLALVVVAYGLLARALFASPALCDRTVGRLPLIGRLRDDRLLTRKVALSDVVGNYQRIKDGKQVFVITGKALNTATVALHSVQISGRLYGNDGVPVDQKVIYCGNVISAKVLKDLTPGELSILQKLNPPKRFMIEPGESSSFVIVFMDPPRSAVEFSTQVIAAQHQT